MIDKQEDIEIKQVIQLPIASVGRFARNSSLCKEKVYLIILSTILIMFSSLSVSLFIVHTIVTTPEVDDVKTTLRVEFNDSRIMKQDFIAEIQYQRDSYEYCIQKSINVLIILRYYHRDAMQLYPMTIKKNQPLQHPTRSIIRNYYKILQKQIHNIN